MINEFQHKGYAVLFGVTALILTFIFWGLLPPFYWLGVILIYFFLGVQIGTGKQPGRVAALVLTLLPLWLVAGVLGYGKPFPGVHFFLIVLSLASGWGGMRLAGRTLKGAAFVLQHVAWPLTVSLMGMLIATLLMFLASASVWPWEQVPPYAILLPVVLSISGIGLGRKPGRCWWRDAGLVWLAPFLFFVVYRPLWGSGDMEPDQTAHLNLWMCASTIFGILLTFAWLRVTVSGKPETEKKW